MAKKKQPYIPFYTGDHLKDTRMLSLEAKGAWTDLIMFIWINGAAGIIEGSMEDFARMVGTSEVKFASVLLELCRKNICDVFGDQTKVFKIVCRRLAREAAISEVRSESGSKGGSKTQAKGKAKTKQKPDNDIDNEIEIDNTNQKESISIGPDETLEIVPQGTNDEIIEEKLLELDEIYLNAQATKWPHLDFDYEYRTFCEKVRGSPEFYKDHREGGIRLAFQKQLRDSPRRKQNGNSKTTHTGNKNTDHLRDLAKDFAERHGAGPTSS